MPLPGAPVFLVQQTYRGRNALPEIGAARIADGRVPPGLLLDFGAVHLRGVRDGAANRGQLGPLLATSSTYGTSTKQGVPMAPWVQRAAPTTRPQWAAVIHEALVEQRALGADALTLPGAELSAAGYPNELE